MPTPFLPYQRDPIAGGLTTPNNWYEFFRSLRQFIIDSGLDTGIIDQILARLDELEENNLGQFVIQGLLSVQALGLPQNGIVQVQLVNDELAPPALFYYRTDADGAKGWSLIKPDELPISLLGVYPKDEDGDYMVDENNSFIMTDLLHQMAADPDSPIANVQQAFNVMMSPGIITGGEVTELTGTSVRITGGTALLRIADDNVSELRFFSFDSQDFSVPDVQVTHFYALDYNGGSPIMVETTGTENWDRDTQIPLGSALRGNGLLNITPNPYRTGDVITNLIQRLDAVSPVQRDNSVGGLGLGETGTRNVTVAAGRMWARVSDFSIPSKNSATDTMASLYFNGTNLTVTSGLTQWDNLHFNNLGTGLLQVLGNNKYANLWFFMSFNGDHFGFAYGTNEYNTLGDAANEAIPSYLTQNFFNQFILLGRFIFQKSAATATTIESAFVTPFSSAAVNTHNDLGGLQGGTTGEFYHLTAAQQADVATLSTGGTTGQFWRGDQVYSNTLVGDFTASTGTINQTGTVTGSAFLFRINGNLNNNNTAQQSVATYQAGVSPSGASLTDLQGLLFLPSLFSSSANVTNVNCITARADAAASYTGTVTNIVAFNALNPSWSGSVIPANYRGLTVANITNFTSTARGVNLNLNAGTGKHNVYAGGTADNYFGGNVGIGTTTPSTALHVVGNFTQAGARLETAVVSPAQLTANTDDWAITGITTASTVRASTDASRTVTGIASPTANQMLLLVNIGTQDLVLAHDTTSTAANRFLCPGSVNFTLNTNDSVRLWYDNTSSRWRVLGV